jgi:hypothetical protein
MALLRSIARNVLLLTMITDNELSDEVLSKIWNSFFHFFLDEKSHSFLIAQCQTLIEVSESITAWNNSKYSKFIRMCNVNTLLELRRHWELYVQAGQLSSAGKKRLKEMVFSSIKTTKATNTRDPDFFHVALRAHIFSSPRNLPARFSSIFGRLGSHLSTHEMSPPRHSSTRHSSTP